MWFATPLVRWRICDRILDRKRPNNVESEELKNLTIKRIHSIHWHIVCSLLLSRDTKTSTWHKTLIHLRAKRYDQVICFVMSCRHMRNIVSTMCHILIQVSNRHVDFFSAPLPGLGSLLPLDVKINQFLKILLYRNSRSRLHGKTLSRLWTPCVPHEIWPFDVSDSNEWKD